MLTPEQALDIINKGEKIGDVLGVKNAILALQAHYHESRLGRLRGASTDDLKFAYIKICTAVRGIMEAIESEYIEQTVAIHNALASYNEQQKEIDEILQSRGIDITTMF